MSRFALPRAPALAALCLLAAAPAGAQPRPAAPRVRPTGTQAFRLLLHASGLKPLARADDLEDKPREKLLIVFGSLAPLEQLNADLPGGLAGFLKGGGALLVASDRKVAGVSEPAFHALNQLFHTFPEGTLVVAPDPDEAYLKQPRCPYVQDFPQEKHPLFRGVERLATNTPSFLVLSDRRPLPVLARFPRGCFLGRPPQGEGQPGGGLAPAVGQPAYMAGNDGPAGKLLIIAGHGVFMNNTLYNQGNFTFTRNCLDWFTKDEQGKRVRRQALFIEEGRVVSKFEVPLVEIPPPPLPTVRQVDRLLSKLEEENFFNRLLLTWLGPPYMDRDSRMAIAKARLLRISLIALSAVLLLYGARRLWRARHRTETRVPLVAGDAGPTRPLVAQRHRDMLGHGNLWEAARELARQCFAAYAARAAVQPPHRPRVVIGGPWWRRRALDRRVRQLWELAYESAARPVTPAQLLRLSAEADDVRAALASGVLTLHDPAVPDWKPSARQPAAP